MWCGRFSSPQLEHSWKASTLSASWLRRMPRFDGEVFRLGTAIVTYLSENRVYACAALTPDPPEWQSPAPATRAKRRARRPMKLSDESQEPIERAIAIPRRFASSAAVRVSPLRIEQPGQLVHDRTAQLLDIHDRYGA